jgi:hypothetical protein
MSEDDADNKNGGGDNNDGIHVNNDSNSGDQSTGTGDRSNNTVFPPDRMRENPNNQADKVADSMIHRESILLSTCSLRILMMVLFLSICIYVPIVVFTSGQVSEQESFQTEFEALATKAFRSFEFNIARKLGAIDSLDISFTSYAVGSNSTQPFVTMPDFDLNAANTLALAETFSIMLLPRIEASEREKWETYSVDNQEWIDVALNRKPLSVERRKTQQQRNGIAPTIFRFAEDGSRVADNTEGPFFPVWQNVPVGEGIINFNIMSVESVKSGINAMWESEQAILGKVLEFSASEQAIQEWLYDKADNDFRHSDHEEEEEEEEENHVPEPISNLFYPVFDQFGSDRKLVSVLSMTIYWHFFFQGVREIESIIA